MPNGGLSRAELEELERFFRPLASGLEAFAARHRLLIDRYYNDSSSWSLRFKHPAGGFGSLAVAPLDDDRVEISACWWIDVYRDFTRSIRWALPRSCAPSPAKIDAVLLELLAEVLAWEPGDWSDVVSGYERSWSAFSEREFEAVQPDWPVPLLDA